MIENLLTAGEGRAFVILFDEITDEVLARAICETLIKNSKIILLKSEKISNNNWEEVFTKFSLVINEMSIRQASFISFGATGALVQNLTLSEPKLIRSLILIEPTCRPHPNLKDRIIDYIESKLPLGLPFRLSTTGFDCKAYLQRLRCPVLILLRANAGSFLINQANMMLKIIPTAWLKKLLDSNTIEETKEVVLSVEEFLAVPVKCPQKNK